MKLGILCAAAPHEEEDFNVSGFDSVRDFLGLAPHQLELVKYRITEDEFPEKIDACDAYLITGSPKGAYYPDAWIAKLSDFIRQCHARRKKMVGICFGHQVIAHVLGGRAEKSEKGWGMGLKAMEIFDERPWMTPQLDQANFYYCHQDQVTHLPAEAALLAGNDFCPVGMFVMGDHILALQAHPEFTDAIMQQSLVWFREHTDVEGLDAAAVATPERPNDNAVMAQWVINFLNEKPT